MVVVRLRVVVVPVVAVTTVVVDDSCIAALFSFTYTHAGLASNKTYAFRIRGDDSTPSRTTHESR